MANIDIVNLINNPNARIVIDLPATDSYPGARERLIVGWITQDITIGGANMWNTPEEAAIVSGINKMWSSINSGAALAGSALNQFKGSNTSWGMSQTQVTNPSLTMASYEGSERFTIDVPMLFVSLKKEDDVRSNVAKLLRTVYPEVGWGGAIGSITAPLGYRHGNSQDIQGGIALRIGNWLKIPKILVSENVSFVFSRQGVKGANGVTPLYATGNVQFKAARITGIDEITGFFGQ